MDVLRERLKSERERYSQGKRKVISKIVISELIGLPTSAIGQYERGERLPSAESLAKISQFYGCSADYLLGLTNERREVSASPTKNL